MQLREFQTEVKTRIYAAWQRVRNVGLVLPTGSGKTVVFSNIVHESPQASCIIAHRKELVSQTSVALAQYGVKHRIIGQSDLVRYITRLHMERVGRNFYDPNATCAVACVRTLLSQRDKLRTWAQAVRLWICDEAQHLVKNNEWGKAIAMFPHARGLGVTATPCRADGKGLGVKTDGLIDELVIGPDVRELIDAGHLADYKIYVPPTDVNLEGIDLASDGDYNKKQLAQRMQRSKIVGDIVQEYLKHAPGKLGVTFTWDVESAQRVAAEFNAAGVRAEMLCGNTPSRIRFEVLDRFARRDIMQLVNVDLFGEGFDLPAIETIHFGRATMSLGLYRQQLGRGLRPMPGKKFAQIFDHVGNCFKHGLPETHMPWTLDRRPRGASRTTNITPVRVCPKCTAAFERIHRACPYCGHVPLPTARNAPEFVDGDLMELDAATLAAMRGSVGAVDGAARVPMELDAVARMGVIKRHTERQAAQSTLRDAIAWWAGHQRAMGRPDSESYRRFFHGFGVDVLTAQALGRPAAVELAGRVNESIGR